MQLQLERQQAQAARQQLESARNATRGSGRANAILNANSVPANPNPSVNHNTNASPNPGPAESSTQHNSHSSQFLLSRWGPFLLYTDTAVEPVLLPGNQRSLPQDSQYFSDAPSSG